MREMTWLFNPAHSGDGSSLAPDVLKDGKKKEKKRKVRFLL